MGLCERRAVAQITQAAANQAFAVAAPALACIGVCFQGRIFSDRQLSISPLVTCFGQAPTDQDARLPTAETGARRRPLRRGFGVGRADPLMSLEVEQYMEREGHRKYEAHRPVGGFREGPLNLCVWSVLAFGWLP